MSRVSFSPRRAGLIARVTFIEASRQRLLQLLALGAAVLVLGVKAFQEFDFGRSELKFIADFGYGSVVFFGSILTIVASSQLFFSEIDHRTALTLLAKPVWRTEFILGKFLGVIAVVTLFCGLMTVLLVAVLWSRETALMRAQPEFFDQGRQLRYADIVAVGFAHWLRFGVLAAFTLLIASFAQSSLYTVVVSFGVLTACHLQYLAQDAYLKAGAPILRLGAGCLALVLPNFQVFNLGDLSGTAGGIGITLLARVTGYALFYVLAVGTLTVFSFKRREI